MRNLATAGFLTLMLALTSAGNMPSSAMVPTIGTPTMPSPVVTTTPGPIGSSAAVAFVR